jgi:CubicO group peptidase (beta-lactamase class C family)
MVHPGAAALRRDLAPLIRQVQGQLGVPGLAIAVSRADEVLWCEGFGVGRAVGGAVVGPDTRFRAGSIAKPLTALAVLGLAEQGRLDLDAPLGRLLPDLKIRTRFESQPDAVTPRRLLCHHAGLPTDLIKGMWTEAGLDSILPDLAEEYACFPPGMIHCYSNLGYALLGLLVERTSGRSFAQYMGEALLYPMGLVGSGFASLPPTDRAWAEGHRDGIPRPTLPIRDLPALGLYASAADLGRLMRVLLGAGEIDGHQVITASTIEVSLQPQYLHSGFDLGTLSGLGWVLEEGTLPGCGRVVRHSGSTLGYSAEMVLLPEDGLGVAVLTNGDASRQLCVQLSEEILSRMIGGTAVAGGAQLLLEGLARPPDSDPLSGIAGAYATDFGMVAIAPSADRLCACLFGTEVPLDPVGDGWYALRPTDSGQTLPAALRPLVGVRLQTRIILGREVIIARRNGREAMLGEKVPEGPLPDAWARRVGRYQVDNADPGFPIEDMELKRRGEQLCLTYRMPSLTAGAIQVPLGPIDERQAILQGLGRTRGETVRAIHTPAGERLRWSGLIARRLDPEAT